MVELLVVIAILAILVSLTAAAVYKVLAQGPTVEARTEISHLESALAACRADFGVDVLPSLLVLREDGQYTANGPLRAQYPRTVALLQKMFGRNVNVAAAHDWNGNGQIDQGEQLLEGQHCLVFFLGGIPSAPGGTDTCTGFNSNRTTPTALGGTRMGPYFEFRSHRLRRDTNGFFSYLDVWEGQPYAFFSATKAGNDYTADCPSLGVRPCFDLSRRFLNPNGCQLITAGADKKFGPGESWDPKRGYPDGPGTDDLSNFSTSPLGVPQG